MYGYRGRVLCFKMGEIRIMQMYLMLDKEEKLYGFYPSYTGIAANGELEFIQKKETDTVKALKIELISVDEVRESRNERDYVFCKVEYDNQTYWFNACNYGAAIVELYLMLNRPDDFLQKLGRIYVYYVFSDTPSLIDKDGESPKIYQISSLAENVLKDLNDWNRDLCALAISSMDETVNTENELQQLQSRLLPNIGEITIINEDFTRASVQNVKSACPVVCSYLFLEENDCSYDFMAFYMRCMKLEDKTEFLFWIFIYESCVGSTRLPYVLYKAIIENRFVAFADNYKNKREYFKDWNKRWIKHSTGKIKRKAEVWKFGANKSESDYCFELVKNGIKTATSYLYDEKTFIAPQQYSIVTNWDATEEVQLITNRYYITSFKEITERHAYLEGEGARTLEEWKTIHKDFFTKELAEKGQEFTEDALIVCEEFAKCQWAKKE